MRRWLRRLWSRQVRVLPSQTAYALWSSSYPAVAHNQLMQLEEAAMRELMPDLNGRVVLDLACGSGRYGVLAQQSGARHVIGLDNSAAMLRVNLMQAVAQADVQQLPLADASIDVVVCGLALGHVPQIQPALNEISRVLRVGGVALISDFHPYQALQGAQRLFHAPDGKIYAVEHHIHYISHYFSIAQQSNLMVTHLLEPQWQDKPVVLVLRLHKQT